MYRRLALLAVALSLLCLLVRAARVGIGGDYLDPVAGISAQDESLYSNGAIRMATKGDWLSPRFMERFAFYKPPLATWLAAASARVSGVSRFTLRLPLAFVCSLVSGLVFLIAAKIRSPQAGAAAVLLLIANHLWAVTASMVLTDGLLAVFEAGAMYCLFVDPKLENRWAFWGFAATIAAGILTKTVAGVLPLAAFALYWCFGPRETRAPFLRACAVLATAAALTAPWFAYELLAHFRWFWTEHILTEIWGFGSGDANQQTTAETKFGFYLKRLIEMEPVLFALSLACLPAFYVALRKGRREAIWLACWLGPVVAAPIIWSYRSATYLTPCIAPMAIAAACYWPYWPHPRRKWDATAIACAGLVAGLIFYWEPWGLSFASGTKQRGAAAASAYCELKRGNELISVGLMDDLYASVLPLARLRYAYVGPSMSGGEYVMLDFAAMGISVTPEQFNHLDELRPSFERRLREAGFNSGDPIGSLIVAPSEAALLSTVSAHPSSDFLFPRYYWAMVKAAGFEEHELRDAGPDLFYLLSKTKLPRAPLAWTCEM